MLTILLRAVLARHADSLIFASDVKNLILCKNAHNQHTLVFLPTPKEGLKQVTYPTSSSSDAKK
jgi:hypothetical protein